MILQLLAGADYPGSRLKPQAVVRVYPGDDLHPHTHPCTDVGEQVPRGPKAAFAQRLIQGVQSVQPCGRYMTAVCSAVTQAMSTDGEAAASNHVSAEAAVMPSQQAKEVGRSWKHPAVPIG